MSAPRILITGANGFLGRHAVARWVDEHGTEGLGVLLSRPNGEFAERFPGVETHIGDLLDEEALAGALAGVQVVVHLASKSIDHDGSGFDRVNVEGTRALAQLAQAAGVRRVIYVSSVGVYGHGAHRRAEEGTPLAPDTPFSGSKAEAERILLSAHRRGHFDTVVLRHRFVYGEGDQAVLPRLIRVAAKTPVWIDGGRAELSLVWARDLAEVIRRFALEAPAEAPEAAQEDPPVYHVTDGRPITFRETITTLAEVFDLSPPRRSVPLWLLYGPVRLREKLLGIDPEVSTSSLTSIRLKLVAQDNSFSNRRLAERLPGLTFVPFRQGVEARRDYYAQFA